MTGTPRVVRLLSPHHRRIVILDRLNPRHARTFAQLARFGWLIYVGPARTDNAGWVIPDTDPHLRPSPPAHPRELT